MPLLPRDQNDNTRTRYFAFTWNNPPEDRATMWAMLDALFNTWGGPGRDIQYMIAGYEIGPNRRTPHIQGFLLLFSKHRWRMSQCKEVLDEMLPGAKPKPAEADVKRNQNYCTEEAIEQKEWGELDPVREKEDKYARAMRLASEGAMSEIEPALRLRHHRALVDIANELPEPPRVLDHATSIWIWGPTNQGKSTVTRQALESLGGYYLKDATKWWDGYQGENIALWDEAQPRNLKKRIDEIKLWTDRFSYKGERKGGVMHMRPEIFIIISNWAPWEVYRLTDLATMMKRCTVVEFRNDVNPISKQKITDLVRFMHKPNNPAPDWIKNSPQVLVYTGHPLSKTGPNSPLSAASFGQYQVDPQAYYCLPHGHDHSRASNKRVSKGERMAEMARKALGEGNAVVVEVNPGVKRARTPEPVLSDSELEIVDSD